MRENGPSAQLQALRLVHWVAGTQPEVALDPALRCEVRRDVSRPARARVSQSLRLHDGIVMTHTRVAPRT